MKKIWPKGFKRIPAEPWVELPIEALATGYDQVERHSWYDNLNTSVVFASQVLSPGSLWLDYSGGTGIFVERFFRKNPDAEIGVVIADSSPKFLRQAVEKFKGDERVAFRWIRYLKGERRLQRLDEVIEPSLLRKKFNLVTATNAIHLYDQPEEACRSWFNVLRKKGALHVQSGNIRPDNLKGLTRIIDDTVAQVWDAAIEIARTDLDYLDYKKFVSDDARLKIYKAYRDKIFLPPRGESFYRETLESVGFVHTEAKTHEFKAKVREWQDFLNVFHDAIAGFVGGVEKIEGVPPSQKALEMRLRLISKSFEKVFEGQADFDVVWTYFNARKP